MFSAYNLLNGWQITQQALLICMWSVQALSKYFNVFYLCSVVPYLQLGRGKMPVLMYYIDMCQLVMWDEHESNVGHTIHANTLKAYQVFLHGCSDATLRDSIGRLYDVKCVGFDPSVIAMS